MIIKRIEKCERLQQKIMQDMDLKICTIAKRILEQPEVVLEEINSIENIEKMLKHFTQT